MKKKPKDKNKPEVSLFGDKSEDKDDIDNKKFLIEFVKTMLLVVIFGMGAFMLIRILYSPEKYGLPQALDYLFYPFQYSDLYIVYFLSNLFGLEVIMERSTFIIDYPALGTGGRFEIASACTAVCEMGLIMAVILAFRGPRWKKRFLWGGIFVGIIYVENIIRLMMNYPLYLYLGREGWNTYHMFWMEWGQLIVVMVLLFIYVQFIARKDIMSVYRGKTDENQKGSQGTEASIEKNPKDSLDIGESQRDSPNEDTSSEDGEEGKGNGDDDKKTSDNKPKTQKKKSKPKGGKKNEKD